MRAIVPGMSKPPFVPVPKHVDGAALFAAARRLDTKLRKRWPIIEVGLAALPAPGCQPRYWASWFEQKMPSALNYLQVYAFIVGQALPPVPLRDVRLLDYGGGWGLMGLLAKEAGVGSVTYLDPNEGAARAAATVAEAVALPFDRRLVGDESALTGSYNAVVSSDVIEHVYSPARVFAAIAKVSEPGARSFHQTGANPYSVVMRRRLVRLHRQEEPRLCDERRAVIEAAGMSGPEAEALATASRGLDRADIEAAVARFKADGTAPTPDHPTNTCDTSGYWYERLMRPDAVAATMTRAGFISRVASCYWGPGDSPRHIRAVKHILNLASRLSRRAGLYVVNHYGIAGTRG
ncbi:MAG: methyltransferase domain-containing protein [Sphingomonadaceae bacterium]|nr:methyltransferase domain-containing protein [Sphingomonadaceae bacterium]